MPEYLSLQESGKIEPESEPAQRWLSTRAGRWRIVPAAEDLFLLRRDEVEGKVESLRAVFSGDIKGMALGELMAFLAQSRWTGVLSVASGSIEKTVFIKHGSVKWATSNQDCDRLGQVVQRLGLVSPDDIQRVLPPDPTGTKRIGQALLSHGLVDSAGLYRAIKHQIEEIVYSTLLFESGLFFLYNDPVEKRFAAQINIDLNGLLMDGLRRIDEIGHFKKRIPGTHCYVVPRNREATGLNEEERRVLEAVDGNRTVAEIAAATHMGEFDAIKTLFGLTEAGFVSISEEPPEPTLGGSSERITAEVQEVIRVFNTIFREIFDEVGQMAPTAGYRLGADSFLESNQHGYPDILSGLELDDSGKLSEQALLERTARISLEDTADPARYLCSALNEVMFFVLFQAGEVLPPDRDDELSRRVKTIYKLLEK